MHVLLRSFATWDGLSTVCRGITMRSRVRMCVPMCGVALLALLATAQATKPVLSQGTSLADPVTTVQGLITRVLGADMVRCPPPEHDSYVHAMLLLLVAHSARCSLQTGVLLRCQSLSCLSLPLLTMATTCSSCRVVKARRSLSVGTTVSASAWACACTTSARLLARWNVHSCRHLIWTELVSQVHLPGGVILGARWHWRPARIAQPASTSER